METILAEFLTIGPLCAIALIFALMALNSSIMVPPSELICIAAGFWASQNGGSWYEVAFVATLGNLIGTSIWYQLGIFHQGRADLDPQNRAARTLELMTRRSVDHFIGLFRRSGTIAVCFLRLVPVIRSIISYGAGRAEMPAAKFYASSFVGMGLWSGIWSWSGYFYGLESGQQAGSQLILVWLGLGFMLWLAHRRWIAYSN